MTVRPIAAALGDLTTSEWHLVADRVRQGEFNVWNWHLSDTDREALILARDIGGTVATMQERRPDGGMRLVARLLPVRGVAKMVAERARIAQEGPAAFGKHPRADETGRPLPTPSKPFQRPTQRWDAAERRVAARIGAERLLSGPADETVDGNAA